MSPLAEEDRVGLERRLHRGRSRPRRFPEPEPRGRTAANDAASATQSHHASRLPTRPVRPSGEMPAAARPRRSNRRRRARARQPRSFPCSSAQRASCASVRARASAAREVYLVRAPGHVPDVQSTKPATAGSSAPSAGSCTITGTTSQPSSRASSQIAAAAARGSPTARRRTSPRAGDALSRTRNRRPVLEVVAWRRAVARRPQVSPDLPRRARTARPQPAAPPCRPGRRCSRRARAPRPRSRRSARRPREPPPACAARAARSG